MIDNFEEEKYKFLANDYPCDVYYNGDAHSSVEHAYQAAKTFDADERAAIRNATTAKEAKKIGRSLKLRDGWNDERIPLMRCLLNSKFKDNLDLGRKLLATEDKIIIFGNKYDSFWGYINPSVGENHLGKLLMHTRKIMFVETRDDFGNSVDTFLVDCGWVRKPEGDEIYPPYCWGAPWHENEWFSEGEAISEQYNIIEYALESKEMGEPIPQDAMPPADYKERIQTLRETVSVAPAEKEPFSFKQWLIDVWNIIWHG